MESLNPSCMRQGREGRGAGLALARSANERALLLAVVVAGGIVRRHRKR